MATVLPAIRTCVAQRIPHQTLVVYAVSSEIDVQVSALNAAVIERLTADATFAEGIGTAVTTDLSRRDVVVKKTILEIVGLIKIAKKLATEPREGRFYKDEANPVTFLIAQLPVNVQVMLPTLEAALYPGWHLEQIGGVHGDYLEQLVGMDPSIDFGVTSEFNLIATEVDWLFSHSGPMFPKVFPRGKSNYLKNITACRLKHGRLYLCHDNGTEIASFRFSPLWWVEH